MRILPVLGALALGLASVPASAVAIVGGETRVAFGALPDGLTPGLIGTASIVPSGGLTVSFPITGGVFDGADTVILHDGSGVSLSNGSNTLGLTDFRIVLGEELVFGNVFLNGDEILSDFALFTVPLLSASLDDILAIDSPVLPLSLTDAALGAVNLVFGFAQDPLTNAQLGTVATAPVLAAVPEPGTWLMMIAGFGIVGMGLRRRRLASVTA